MVYLSDIDIATASLPNLLLITSTFLAIIVSASLYLHSSNFPFILIYGFLSLSSSIALSNAHFPLPHINPSFTWPSLFGSDFIRRFPYVFNSILHPTEQYEHVVTVVSFWRGTFFFKLVFSCSAPVGQTDTHWPQDIQDVSSRPCSKAGLTSVSKPLETRPNAPTPITSSQVLTHNPHKIHLFISLNMYGWLSSIGKITFSPSNLSGSTL